MDEAALLAAGVPPSNASCGAGACSGQVACSNYDRLIAPAAPFAFRGLLWYQGESNVECNVDAEPAWHTGYYARLLPSLIESWRTVFETPLLPALVVQLAAYDSTDPTPADRSQDSLPVFRAAQVAGAAATSPPAALIMVSDDLGDDGWSVYTPPSPRHGGLHPRNVSVWERALARLNSLVSQPLL